MLSALVFLDNDEGEIFKMDVIEHEGKHWLVPEWLESIATGQRTPARIILVDNLPHQNCIGSGPSDFVVNIALPTSLVRGGDRSKVGPPFVVQDLPGIDRSPSDPLQ
jgi:hypothetical protein